MEIDNWKFPVKLTQQLAQLNRSMYLALVAVLAAAIFLVWLLSRSTLAVSVMPENAYVTINNRPLQQNTSGDIKTTLSPGTYTLKVEADGYVASIREITLHRARTLKIDASLDKAPEPYTISSENNPAKNVQFLSSADDFNTIFYLADNGSTLYKAKFNINTEDNVETVYNRPISNPPLSGIQNIIWSPKKDASIFKKGTSAFFFDFQKYNFISQEEKKYSDNIGDVAWSPDDSKIAYYYSPPSGEKSLVFADKTNTEVTRVANLADMNINNPYLSWSPDSEWLIVIPRNASYETNKIYLFNAYTRSFAEISDTGNNLEAKFSADGSKIIYSTYSKDPASPLRAVLSVMDSDGSNKKSLDLRADLRKVTWLNNSNSEIIVATWDGNKGAEKIFGYNVDTKQESGFNYTLPAKTYVNDLSLSANNNLLFYVANQQFYIIKLKN